MAKRRAPKGAGTVYQRPDRPGTWTVEVTLDGKRVRRSAGTRAEGHRILAELRSGIGATTRDERLTLAVWLTHWADEIAPRRVEPKTARTYAQIVRLYWLPTELAGRRLRDVGHDEVEDALEDMLGRGLSRTTCSHARAVLSVAYTAALRQRPPLASTNPAREAGLPGRPVPNRVRTMRLSRKSARAISEAFFPTSDRHLVETMLHTGLRPAEALALTWQDIDLGPDARVRVRQAVKRTATGWTIGVPKTAGSQRDVPIDSELRVVLLQHLLKRSGRPYGEMRRVGEDREHVEPIELPDDGLVFATESGGLDNPDDLAKRFRKIVQGAGLSGWTPRDMRTLHASLLIADGIDIATVSRRLGHADPVTTWRRYAAVVTSADRAAVKNNPVHPEVQGTTESKARRGRMKESARAARLKQIGGIESPSGVEPKNVTKS